MNTLYRHAGLMRFATPRTKTFPHESCSGDCTRGKKSCLLGSIASLGGSVHAEAILGYAMEALPGD